MIPRATIIKYNKARQLRQRVEKTSIDLCRALEAINSLPHSSLATKLEQLKFLIREFEANRLAIRGNEATGIVTTMDDLVKKMKAIAEEYEHLISN